MATTSRATAFEAVMAALLAGGLLAGWLLAVGAATTTRGAGEPVSQAAIATSSLPVDFPRARVPLVAGTVLTATGDATDGWNVIIAPATADGMAEATRRLAGLGYLTRARELGPASFTGPGYDVLVTSPDGTIAYAVTPN